MDDCSMPAGGCKVRTDIKDVTPTGEVSHNIVASATLRWPFAVSILDFEAFVDLSYLHLGGNDDIQLSFGISMGL